MIPVMRSILILILFAKCHSASIITKVVRDSNDNGEAVDISGKNLDAAHAHFIDFWLQNSDAHLQDIPGLVIPQDPFMFDHSHAPETITVKQKTTSHPSTTTDSLLHESPSFNIWGQSKWNAKPNKPIKSNISPNSNSNHENSLVSKVELNSTKKLLENENSNSIGQSTDNNKSLPGAGQSFSFQNDKEAPVFSGGIGQFGNNDPTKSFIVPFGNDPFANLIHQDNVPIQNDKTKSRQQNNEVIFDISKTAKSITTTLPTITSKPTSAKPTTTQTTTAKSPTTATTMISTASTLRTKTTTTVTNQSTISRNKPERSNLTQSQDRRSFTIQELKEQLRIAKIKAKKEAREKQMKVRKAQAAKRRKERQERFRKQQETIKAEMKKQQDIIRKRQEEKIRKRQKARQLAVEKAKQKWLEKMKKRQEANRLRMEKRQEKIRIQMQKRQEARKRAIEEARARWLKKVEKQKAARMRRKQSIQKSNHIVLINK